jgi:AcrR family transcriptional regulator
MSSQTPHPIDTTILQTAEQLLAEVGEAFTMEELVSRANISRATVYRRMGSKEALLQRLAQERGVAFEQQPDVRQRILSAARRVFASEGLLSMTMEQVATEAGVGVATVYRHFGDKEGLVLAFIEQVAPRTLVRELARQPGADVEAEITAIVRGVLAFFLENQDILRLSLSHNRAEQTYIQTLRASDDTTRERLANYFARQIEAGRLRAAGEPQELALALMGMVFGFVLIGPTFYKTELKDPEQICHLIATIFLQGLKP